MVHGRNDAAYGSTPRHGYPSPANASPMRAAFLLGSYSTPLAPRRVDDHQVKTVREHGGHQRHRQTVPGTGEGPRGQPRPVGTDPSVRPLGHHRNAQPRQNRDRPEPIERAGSGTAATTVANRATTPWSNPPTASANTCPNATSITAAAGKPVHRPRVGPVLPTIRTFDGGNASTVRSFRIQPLSARLRSVVPDPRAVIEIPTCHCSISRWNNCAGIDRAVGNRPISTPSGNRRSIGHGRPLGRHGSRAWIPPLTMVTVDDVEFCGGDGDGARLADPSKGPRGRVRRHLCRLRQRPRVAASTPTVGGGGWATFVMDSRGHGAGGTQAPGGTGDPHGPITRTHPE